MTGKTPAITHPYRTPKNTLSDLRFCTRCSNVWFRRLKDDEPATCPHCGSARWQKARPHRGRYTKLEKAWLQVWHSIKIYNATEDKGG